MHRISSLILPLTLPPHFTIACYNKNYCQYLYFHLHYKPTMDYTGPSMCPITPGFLVCIHNCVKEGCPNAAGSILWARNGNSLRKHAINVNRHPMCTMACPGNGSLSLTSGRIPCSREPTDHEYHMALQNSECSDDMDIDAPIMEPSIFYCPTPYEEITRNQQITRDNTPHASISSTVDLDDEILEGGDFEQFNAPPLPNDPCFKIVYVPDPTRTTTPALASADLAFLKTTITPQEYTSMKHLTGSIHYIGRSGPGQEAAKYVVYMQEWVSNIMPDNSLYYLIHLKYSFASWFGSYVL